MLWLVCGSGLLGSAYSMKVESISLEAEMHKSFRYAHLRPNFADADQIEVLEKHKPGVFLNAAGPTNISESIFERDEYERQPVNLAMAHMRLLASLKQPPIYIYLSSAAVYGETSPLGVNELTDMNPISPYGIGKMLTEQYLLQASVSLGVPVIILRVFSSYSINLKARLPFAILKKFQSSPHALFEGSGNELRDFVHTDDIVSATTCILNDVYRTKINVWNIGSGISISVSEVVAIAREVYASTNSSSEYSFSFTGISRPSDPINLTADISKLQSIGYEPKIKPRDGLKEYFESNVL